jgi:lipid-A-disaccharide synthase
MAKIFDLALALLPFEPPFFEKYGLRCEFVGHPVLERQAKMKGGDALRAKLGIAADTPLLLVLPGSRTNEIRFILPVFKLAVQVLASRIPRLVTVLPTVPHVAAKVRAAVEGWPTPLHLIEDENGKYAAFVAADAALAASGTVTTELALARTPMVVAYRVGGFTYLLAKPLFRLPYFTLVNLLLDRMAVPEFLQHAATPNALADAVERLLLDKSAAAEQRADLDAAARMLGEGTTSPSRRAAEALLQFVRSNRAA